MHFQQLLFVDFINSFIVHFLLEPNLFALQMKDKLNAQNVLYEHFSAFPQYISISVHLK